MSKVWFKFGVVFLLILWLLVGCGRSSTPQQIRIVGSTMGTSYLVKYVVDEASPLADDLSEQTKLAKKVKDYLVAFNRVFSTYDEESELSLLNLNTNKSTGVQVSGRLYLQFVRAVAISKRTEFSFEPTVAPLVNLWGFGWKSKKRDVLPTAEEIKAAMKLTGITKVTLGETNFEAIDLNGKYTIKMPDTMQVDFSAIAKGRGVDGVAELLEKQGVQHYLVEIGGEISAKGNKEGIKESYERDDENRKEDRVNRWKVLVASPSLAGDDSVKNTSKLIDLKDHAIATSGDYLNYFEKDGVRYSHTINPKTGAPITNRLASVSVISSSCEEADALATALMVMGEVHGVEYATTNNLAAFFVYRDKVKKMVVLDSTVTNTQVNIVKERGNGKDEVTFKQYTTEEFSEFLIEEEN